MLNITSDCSQQRHDRYVLQRSDIHLSGYRISEFSVGNIDRLQDCQEGHVNKGHVVYTRL
jgi:hypothetical protein